MTFEGPSRDLQPPGRHRAGEDVGSSAAGPKPGRTSFSVKLGRAALLRQFDVLFDQRFAFGVRLRAG